MKAFSSNGFSAILAVCAVTITGLVVRRELFPPTASATPAVRTIADWEPLLQGGSVVGPSNAPIKIVFFSDFQCPFCIQAHAGLARLREAYPGRVAVIYRHFPLESIHPYARSAALAAECAAEQGRFEEYQDALFAAQGTLYLQQWQELAGQSGVPDLSEFARCVVDARHDDRIVHDLELGRSIGVNGTPAFVLDGRMVSGTPGIELLEEWIREIPGAQGGGK